MTERSPFRKGGVPLRALILSVGAFLVPVVGTLAFPEQRAEVEALLWLVALVPAFLLAYYRGWKGVATALAAGMALLSITHAGVTLLDRDLPGLLLPSLVAYLAVGLGIGWVSELLHRQRMAVEDMALTDPLTGLPNRRHARVFLEHEFGSAQRGSPLALVLFDLDNFKGYNDRYGHPAGDAALRAFAEILANTTRRMNISARQGGEEFISIVTGSDEKGASVFADRVREALEKTSLEHGALTVSAGVAGYHPLMESPDDLVAAADVALYQAKADGRNCVRIFTRPADISGSSTPSAAAEGVSTGAGSGQTPVRRPTHPPDGLPRSEEVPGNGSREAAGQNAGQLATTGPLPHGSRLGDGREVLLVEDDEAVRSTVAAYLAREGFRVSEASDVPGGLRAMTSECDLVITDIGLPGASGLDLVSALKARWPEAQVIVITGHREVEAAADAVNAGADRYLLKPFELTDLRQHVLDSLRRRDRSTAANQERDRLAMEARERAAEAREAVLRGTRALVRAVEVRDPYTLGHSERVASYAVILAGMVGGQEVLDLDRLHLGCELHDVGKIGIPDAILNKEAPLTPEEFEQVRKHPETGRTILEPLLGDEMILAITAWHHERWDGLGYPDGLQGEAIPFPARLVALVDTLDAMTSTRAYRSRLPWNVAVSHILEQGGTQFDPGLIEAFRAAVPLLYDSYQKVPT